MKRPGNWVKRVFPSWWPARSLEAANETAKKLTAEGIEAYPVALDVTKQADRVSAAKFVSDKFGKLDILINNAGVGPEDSMFALKTVNTTEKELQTVFGTNVFSVLAVSREFLPSSQKKRSRTHRELIQHSGFSHLACRS